MKNNYQTLFTYLLLTLALSACSTTPNHVIIAPAIGNNFTRIYPATQLGIKVTDLRANRHIVQILQNEGAAQLINSATAINEMVKNSFTQIFSQQGLSINQNSGQQINIFIDAAVINVKQELLKYQANNQLVLRIEINTVNNNISKTFRIQGKSNGPLSADLAVLERDFNQQLAKLIQQIVTDAEIQTFINNLS
jgi:uncharacterized lipoprotein